jgi:hypothetical protein
MAEETYEEIRARAYEEIETMILTLDASQLFDHDDDQRARRLGAAMFNVIVDRIIAVRTRLDEALEQSMEKIQ